MRMDPNRLWAKKKYEGMTPPSVAEHCRDVHDAANALFDAIRQTLADGLGVSANSLDGEIRPLLLAAALMHDFAKINSAFQYMLRAKPGDPVRQPVRHEILGAWLLSDPDYLHRWFGGLRSEAEIWPIIWAVAGHHLKMGDPARDAKLFNAGSGTREVVLPLSDDEIGTLLRDTAAVLGSTSILLGMKDSRFETADDSDNGLEQRIAQFAELSCRVWNRLRRNDDVVRRTALLKALLIAADVAASALTAKGEPLNEWVPRQLALRISADSLQPIIAKGTKGKPPKPFQTIAGDFERTATILIAGCGGGKTTAAYMWAQRHARGRKLWFTYPTTGTASAGYHGYLFDHPDLLSALMHGRAEVDLQAMRGTKEDDPKDEWLRLESLRAWGCQAILCTVDTVLGLLQNQKRPLFSFPAIASGAIVFDEIHSYDARLFGGLLRFLQTFPGIPVLLMSASIPPRRMEALRDVLGERACLVGPGESVEQWRERNVIRGDRKMEEYLRYRLQSRESAAACQELAADTLRAGKKVLWVCNTVKDAIEIAKSASQWTSVEPIVYHSRFRYRDRVTRQQVVLAEFKNYVEGERDGQRVKPSASLVIATQVCEMSLDISADLLITAECPLPSLVQRLGRLNRYASSDDPWPCLVYAFQGDPYNEKPELIQTRGDCRASMAATRKLVNEMDGQACRQQDLADRLNLMQDAEQFETYSNWLDDGWLTEPGPVRDGDASITLIREEDLPEIKNELGAENAKPTKWTSARLVPWTIPMLPNTQVRLEERKGGYPIAPVGTVDYSEKEGATWHKTTK